MNASGNFLKARSVSAVLRTGGFLAFWWILSGFAWAEIPVGLFTAVLATWASLWLLPQKQSRFRPIALMHFTLRFLSLSIVAGLKVAWRALHPKLPLQPGFMTYASRLPPGPLRDSFCVISSMLPGTLIAGNDPAGNLVVHCLDVTEPIAEELATTEALELRLLHRTRRRG